MTTAPSTASPSAAAPTTAQSSAWRRTAALWRSEAILLARSPAALAWMVALPLAALVVMMAVPGARRPIDAFGSMSVLEAYQPTLIVFSSTMLAFQVMPMTLGDHRELGYLRRLRATPAHPRDLLVAVLALVLAVTLLIGLVMTLLPLVVGVGSVRGALLMALLLVPVQLSFLAVGALVSAVIPNPRVASGVGAVLAAVMWFFAGMWYPRAQFPDWLVAIADWTPGGAATTLLTAASQGGDIGVQPLVCLLAWIVGSAAVAVRAFRWE